MILHSTQPDGPLNVKKMAIEEPAASDVFVPESDLTAADWESLQNNLDLERILGRYDRFIYLAAALTALGRAPQLTEDDRDMMRDELQGFKEDDLMLKSSCSILAAMAIVGPRKDVVNEEELGKLKLEHFGRFLMPLDEKLNLAHAITVLSGTPCPLDDGEWMGMLEACSKHRAERDGRALARSVMMIRLLGGHRRLDTNDWACIRRGIAQSRAIGIHAFANTATHAAIAAAAQIRITENGMEVIARKKRMGLPADIAPLPTVRTYVPTLPI